MSRRIALVDLRAQYAGIAGEIDAAIEQVIDSGVFVGGENVARFEEEFSDFCGIQHAVAVANGTDALELTLHASGIGPGDEVLVPTMTFAASAEAVVNVGATPVLVDCDQRTMNIDPARARESVTPATRAIVVVHLYGQPADMDVLTLLAEQENLILVEDSAQAHGAKWRGKPVGSFGLAGTFSFYPGKNLGAYGDGGAVVTNDASLAARVRSLANHGRKDKYVHERCGRNSRLDNLQAAILRVKLRRLVAWNERRRAIAERYRARLTDLVTLLLNDPRAYSVHHLFAILVHHREAVRDRLGAEGISTGIHYPVPLHRQPAFRHYCVGVRSEEWVADTAAAKLLSLPMYPELSDEQVDRVSDVVAASLDQ